MPYEVEKRGGKYRLVNPQTDRVARTSSGKPRDGGGHESRARAKRQARAIMESERDGEKGRNHGS